MGRPKGNGLVELIDDNADRGRGFFCMDLVSLMWNDEAVKGWEEWHACFEQARCGECPTATVASDTGGRWRAVPDGPYS